MDAGLWQTAKLGVREKKREVPVPTMFFNEENQGENDRKLATNPTNSKGRRDRKIWGKKVLTKNESYSKAFNIDPMKRLWVNSHWRK